MNKKNGCIRIIHISDIHVSGWTRQLEDEVNALAEDVQRNFPDTDYVVITGDLTMSGNASQFEIIEKKIFPRVRSAAQVADKKFIIVPGNHDINRCAVKEVERTAIASLHQGRLCAEKLFQEI